MRAALPRDHRRGGADSRRACEPAFAGIPTPRELYEQLNQYVIGQERAKKILSVAVYNHYKRINAGLDGDDDVELQKSNILLVGPTGCGKTLLAQTLAKLLDVPFSIADATALTEAGYVGEDVENILLRLIQAAGDVAAGPDRHHLHRRDRQDRPQGGQPVDHPRRLRRGRAAGAAEDHRGHGRQRAAAERPQAPAPGIHPDRHPQHPLHLRRRLRGAGRDRRQADRQAGADRASASSAEDAKVAIENPLQYLTHDDLLKYGLIPEFVGRLPVTVALDPLTADELMRILTEPKNAVVKQYQKFFALDNVELVFTDDALEATARQAEERKTGARGLRTTIEEVLLDVMYEIPSLENVRKCVVDANVINNRTRPLLMTVSEQEIPYAETA